MTANDRITPEQAREQLTDTLNAIEDRLNVPKRFAAAKRDNPGGVIAGGVVLALAAGAVTWAIVRSLSRR